MHILQQVKKMSKQEVKEKLEKEAKAHRDKFCVDNFADAKRIAWKIKSKNSK